MALQKRIKILQENNHLLLEESINDWILERLILLDGLNISTLGVYDSISFTAHLQITNQIRYTAYIEYKEE